MLKTENPQAVFTQAKVRFEAFQIISDGEQGYFYHNSQKTTRQLVAKRLWQGNM